MSTIYKTIDDLPPSDPVSPADTVEISQLGQSHRITVAEIAQAAVAGGDARTVSLLAFLAAPNPLQAAVDYLGPEGGTIRIPNQRFTIPSQVVGGVNWATSNLRGLALIGEGPNSVLIFPSGGGIVLYMGVPHGGQHAYDQVIVERLAIMTTQFTTPLQGSGTGLAISFPLAVGDVTAGVTLRDVQVINESQQVISGASQWWNTCIQTYNAREITFANVYTTNGTDTNTALGVGIDLNGGTVQIQFSDVNVAGHDKGVYINGVCEGVQWNRGVTIGNNYGVWIDGDVDGRARSASTTSHTIGTGSKTFTVAHNIRGPDGLAWTAAGGVLVIRDTAAPTVNNMVGTITGFTLNTVTVNVTSVAGSGTKNSWTLSTEHKVSQNTIHAVHCNNNLGNYFLRWAAFTNIHDCEIQPRDAGHTTPFWHIDMAQENGVTYIHDMSMSALAPTAQVKGGILIRGTYTPSWNTTTNNARNYYTIIRDLQFSESASFSVGVRVEANADSVDIAGLRTLGNISGNLVDNLTVGTTNVRAYDCHADLDTSAWRPFAANTATPNVAMDGFNRWYTTNTVATTITNFVGGCIGEAFDLVINDSNTTIAHVANILLRDAVNYAPPAGTVMRFSRNDGTAWREINRSPSFVHNFRVIKVSDIAEFGGSITNGMKWQGWLYQTANLNAAAFDAGWTTGVALGWNFAAGGEANYILRTGGPHKFQWKIGAGAVVDADVTCRIVNTQVLTVGTLPAAATVGAGARAYVTDANAATFNTVAAAGGANKVPVFSDGAAWRIG